MKTSNEIDLQTIRIVQALDQERTITGVAKLLGLSQPAVSQHLQRAETRLGVALVRRRGRFLELTKAGQIVLESAPAILVGVADIQNGLETVASMHAGQIRIAGIPSVSPTIVPRLYRRLRSARPGMSVTYVEHEPPEIIESVSKGRSDLGIICTYLGEGWRASQLAPLGLETVDLFMDPFFALVPRGHTAAGELVDLGDLRSDEWVVGCRASRGHVVETCRLSGFDPRISMETHNFSAVVGFVAAGLGVSILPGLALQTVAIPKGVVIAKSVPHSYRMIQFIHRNDAGDSPAMQTTIQALLGAVGSLGGAKRG